MPQTTNRSFHFETIEAAGRFCESEGIPTCLVRVLGRNSNGIATYCEITVPAELFAEAA